MNIWLTLVCLFHGLLVCLSELMSCGDPMSFVFLCFVLLTLSFITVHPHGNRTDILFSLYKIANWALLWSGDSSPEFCLFTSCRRGVRNLEMVTGFNGTMLFFGVKYLVQLMVSPTTMMSLQSLYVRETDSTHTAGIREDLLNFVDAANREKAERSRDAR
jgi:hypothetical protein